MKSMFKVVFVLILPVTAFLLLLSGVFNEKIEPGVSALEQKEIEGVKVEKVTKKSYQSGFSVTGTIVAEESADVSSNMMAEVENVLVNNGTVIKKGDTLIELDSNQVKSYVNQALAQIDAANAQMKSVENSINEVNASIQKAEVSYQNEKKSYERTKKSYEQGLTSEQEYDDAYTRYQVAEADLNKAQASLETVKAKKDEIAAQIKIARTAYNTSLVNQEDATIRAPFSGVIVNTLVDVGDMASPGVPLLKVETSPYYFEIFVNESNKTEISSEDEIDVTINSLNQTYKGVVTEITPTVDPASRTFRVKIKLPNDLPITSGMFGHAVLPEAEKKGIFIPNTAIYRWSQMTAVYVVDDSNITHLKYVQLGNSNGEVVEILSGLNEGERIIKDNIEIIEDQMKVVDPT